MQSITRSTFSIRQPYVWILLLALIAVTVFTLMIGDIPFSMVWADAVHRLTGVSNQWNPLLDERLPRLIILLLTGASLAVSGTVMQSLFQNPLASPTLLGISSGGGLFMMPVILMGWYLHFPFMLPAASMLGCLLTLLLVYAVSMYKGDVRLNTLIITGIAISTIFLSIQGALTYALRDRWQLMQMLTEWEAGSSFDRTWRHVHMQLPLAFVGLYGCWYYAEEIDILSLGDEEAKSLGVDVRKIRWRLFLCVALLIGGALAALGLISFFGFILPHVIRKIFGPKNKTIIPLCLVIGAISLTFIDASLRFFNIHALSVGNISAMIGGIFFLYVLLRSSPKGRLEYA